MHDHFTITTSANIEIASVVIAALFIWISALVQNFSNALRNGPRYVMSDRSHAVNTDGFYGRATRTLSNNMESALMYIPPMIIVIVSGLQSELTAIAAAIYIGARLIFVLSYWFNVVGLRSTAWFVGMVCCVVVVGVDVHGLAFS